MDTTIILEQLEKVSSDRFAVAFVDPAVGLEWIGTDTLSKARKIAAGLTDPIVCVRSRPGVDRRRRQQRAASWAVLREPTILPDQKAWRTADTRSVGNGNGLIRIG